MYTAFQMRGIKGSAELGKKLQREIPQIANDYRLGKTLAEIALQYSITSKYDIDLQTAKKAVSHAISGFRGGFGVSPYNGLIQDKHELERLNRQHISQSSAKTARIKGIFTFREKKGIHAYTLEQRIAIGERAGVNSAIARGYMPWAPAYGGRVSEQERAYQLSQRSEYRNGNRINVILIVEELNKEYHHGKNVRNTNAIKAAISRFRKKFIPETPHPPSQQTSHRSTPG